MAPEKYACPKRPAPAVLGAAVPDALPAVAPFELALPALLVLAVLELPMLAPVVVEPLVCDAVPDVVDTDPVDEAVDVVDPAPVLAAPLALAVAPAVIVTGIYVISVPGSIPVETPGLLAPLPPKDCVQVADELP